MAEAGASEKLKVFISYSRRDSTDFIDELVAGLELAGFAPFLDRHDIAAGEKWEERLGGLIGQADTVVFVISPESVKSERCAWEVERTLEQSKRLLPIVFKPVPETDMPEQLRERQFIRFDIGPGITRPLAELAQALRHNIEWIREHTRIGELAVRWGARGRPPSLLLRGEDVAAAKDWAAKRNPHAPEITELQREFLKVSEQVERKRVSELSASRKSTWQLAILSSLLLLAVGAGLAWSNLQYLRARTTMLMETLRPKTLSAETENALKAGSIFKECADCPEMAVVPPGVFVTNSGARGAPVPTSNIISRRPNPDRVHEESLVVTDPTIAPIHDVAHTVAVATPFAASRFEVTFDEWDACYTLGGCKFYPSDQGWGRGTRPVINVSWRDAQEYVAWLSRRTGKPYRLLSEVEWESAARAGSAARYSWGEEIGKGNANCNGCGSEWDGQQTAPVGSFAPNPFGLYDMYGNVGEWVEDCFGGGAYANIDFSVRQGSGECGGRLMRGGSWGQSPETLSANERFVLAPEARRSSVGFRAARTLAIKADAIPAYAPPAQPPPAPAPAAASGLPSPIPASIRPEEIVGRWGYGAYLRKEDSARTLALARGQCSHPFVIARGPTGGVMMYPADSSQLQEFQVKGSATGKNYIGPPGAAGGMYDREIVSFDGRVMVLRWMDPEVFGRFGTSVYVRCRA
jgi:formylglycine-generating enzyme required for sulfatase activity